MDYKAEDTADERYKKRPTLIKSFAYLTYLSHSKPQC